jgi:hypothetical protein
MLYSFWCKNTRCFRDRAQLKLCCFCESEDEDWRHVLSCPGTGVTIKRNIFLDIIKVAHTHFDIPFDIWNTIEYGIKYFNNYQKRENTPSHRPPFPGSLAPLMMLLNDAFASQSKIGQRKFLKGCISKKWGRLLTPKRKNDVIAAFERAMITSLWKHALQLWEFMNDESQKDKIRSIAEYKHHTLDDKIREA